MHLVEPQNVGLTPLAFLALGAAAPAMHPRPVVPVAIRGLLVGAGVVLAVALLRGAYHFEQARLDFGLGDARQARQLLPPWPEVRDQTARIYVFEAKTRRDPARLALAERWRRAAVAVDPGDPTGWNDLADVELSAGHTDAAADHFREALKRNPVSARALNGLGRIEMTEGREREAAELFRRARLVTSAEGRRSS
jgi:tetratricopeptide (TPR) repeat protein